MKNIILLITTLLMAVVVGLASAVAIDVNPFVTTGIAVGLSLIPNGMPQGALGMSLVNSLMQNLRIAYPNQLDKYEERRSRYGALDFLKAENSRPNAILSSDAIERIKMSMGRTVDIPVIDADGGISIGSARSLTISDSENTSQLVNLTFTTYAFGFTMYPAQHFNNDIAYQSDFDRKMLKYLHLMAATLDSAALTLLATDKTQVAPDLLGKYTFAANTLEVALANQAELISDIEPMMASMDFYNPVAIIGNPGLLSLVRFYSQQGAANSVNYGYQFQGHEFFYTNRLANALNKKATLYAIQEGTCAILTRNERDAIMGSKTGNGKMWDLVNLPILDLDFDSYYYDDAVDANALHAGTADMTRTRKEFFGFSVDVAFISAYNSDPTTRKHPILKAQIATT